MLFVKFIIVSIIDRVNYGIYRYKYLNGRRILLKSPVDLMLELSSHCNLSCNYCYHSKDNAKNLPFKKGFMSRELAESLLVQGARIGVHSVKFNFRGEGTLHPDYKSISFLARDLAKGSTYIDRIVNSNFKFGREREDIFEALCAMTKIKVSFDSFIPSVLENQRCGAKFDHITANIDKFYNYPGRDNTLVIQAVRTNLNKDEDIEGEVKKRWPEALVSVRDVVSGRKQEDIEELEVRKRDFSQRQPCKQAFARLVVHHDGKVSVCCPDISGKLIIGDANKESLKSIFSSRKAKKIRRDLKSKTAFNLNPCKNCSSYESFKGYRAPRDS